MSVSITNNGSQTSLTNIVSARVRSKSQQYILQQMVANGETHEALTYLLSFNGEYQYQHGARRIRYQNKDNSRDPLALKPNNSVLEMFNRRFDPTSVKKPSNQKLGEWVGVEIECIVPLDSLDLYYDDYPDTAELEDAVISSLVCQLRDARIPNVEIKSDGSLRYDDDCYGVEFTILFTRDNKKPLEQLCALLSGLNAHVNRSCGLHVHLDCRDLIDGTKKMNNRLASIRAKRLGNCLDLLYRMVPQSRRENNYCRPSVSGLKNCSRYYAVNRTSLRKHKTIEIRLHSGTTNFNKISNWIDLIYLISRSPKLTSNKVSDLTELTSKVALPESLIGYIASRISTFEPNRSITHSTDSEDRDSAA